MSDFDLDEEQGCAGSQPATSGSTQPYRGATANTTIQPTLPRVFATQPTRVGPAPIGAPIPDGIGYGEIDVDEWIEEDQADLEEQRQMATVIDREGNKRTIQTRNYRVEQGIQPWARTDTLGRPMGMVTVHHARLDEPSIRKLDGSTTFTTKACVTLPYKPLYKGTTVLEYGKGGMKTFRTNEFADIHDISRRIYVTPRRNLAWKLSSDLAKAGVECHNYLDIKDDNGNQLEVSVVDWCDFDVIIISAEQVHKLMNSPNGFDRFRGGMLFIDEPETLCGSLGGSTIMWPESTLAALKRLSTVVDYTILAGADVSIDGRVESLVKAIAPMNNVLHLASTMPATERTLFLAFNSKGTAEQRQLYDEHIQLSLYDSMESRSHGAPNRTFLGAMTPKALKEMAKKATNLGVPNTIYHGNTSEEILREHFKDIDGNAERFDVIGMTTVGAIGTDMSLKCSRAFFETTKGSATMPVASLRMLSQLTGRPGRARDAPLDSLTLEDGTVFPGAMFMLVGGRPPTPEELEPNGNARGTDRVSRKFFVRLDETEARLKAARAADQECVVEFMRRNDLRIDDGHNGGAVVVQAATPRKETIETNLADIIAWNDVERADNYESHFQKIVELFSLPSGHCTIRPIPKILTQV